MNLLCVDVIVSLAGTTLLDYTNLFFVNDYKIKFLDEIKHNDLMSEKYKKTFKLC